MGDKLEKPLHQLREAARRVAEICDESEIAMDVEEYVAKVSVYVRFYPIGTPEHIQSIRPVCVHACVFSYLFFLVLTWKRVYFILRFSASPLIHVFTGDPLH